MGSGNPLQGYVYRHTGYTMFLNKVTAAHAWDRVYEDAAAYIYLGGSMEMNDKLKSEIAAVQWAERKVYKWLRRAGLIHIDLALTTELPRKTLKERYEEGEVP